MANEAILEPDLAICDPHHHYWNHDRNPYLLEQLHADTGSGHNVVSTVFIDCMAEYKTDGPDHMKPVGETEFIIEAAERSDTGDQATIAGIVSFADLSRGKAVEEVLDAHVEAGRGRFRGIRHATTFDADPLVQNGHTDPPAGLMGQADFREGFSTLGQMGLSFDAWMYAPQLGELVDLVKAQPETTVILDHLGGPLAIGPYKGRRDEVLAMTKAPIQALAEHDQVFMKLGGIGMSLYGDGWHKLDERPSSDIVVERWGDHINWIIEQFGPDRCMFESNFPVDKVGIDYDVLWNAFKKMAAGFSPTEKAWLFHDAAAKAYRT
jgi:L-fuconolactonase